MGRDKDVFCARAFQSAVACINADRGNSIWSRRGPRGTQGVGTDATLVVGGDASDRLTAWATRSPGRGLDRGPVPEPQAQRPAGDGQVRHRRRLGGLCALPVARQGPGPFKKLSTDSSGIAAAPVQLGDTVLIATRGGRLFALRQK
ncbi:hypothetical protein Ddc_24865 [Ditylenchus destructor]|nr:hypothetical protein Ddc_24865 [Ditylenchus destructor]